MVVNTLKEICIRQEQTGSTTRFQCCIPSEFYGFEGHFEGQPILPGVCQLKLVTEAVAAVSGPPRIDRIDRMKFHNFIVPGTAFTLEIESSGRAWQYRLYSDDTAYASGKIILR